MLCRYSISFKQFALCQERLISRSTVCAEFYLSFLYSLPLSCAGLTQCYSTTCLRIVVYPFAPNLYSHKSCFSLTPPSSATRVVDYWRYMWYISQWWKNKLHMLKKLKYFVVWLLLSMGILQVFGIVMCQCQRALDVCSWSTDSEHFGLPNTIAYSGSKSYMANRTGVYISQ